jgi:mannose-1-phosphate guanylyltransferase/mannose-6-phosphate isomerase
MNANTQSLALDMTEDLNREAMQWGFESRPWGYLERLAIQDCFQVKRIVVSPGQTLSLQKHSHLARHWVILKGVAEVVRGEKNLVLHPNQSVYIPSCTLHRLHNPGSVALELIEVQTGSYFAEDNIIRYGDIYGRNETGK